MNSLLIVSKLVRGTVVCDIRRRPTPLSAGWILLFMCWLSDNLLSEVSARCFCFELSLISELLKKSGGCVFHSRENNFLCLLSSIWIEWQFPFACLVLYFNKLLLSVEAETFTQFTMLNKEVSSATSSTSEFSLRCRSLI